MSYQWKDRHGNQDEKIENSEIESHIHDHLIFYKGAKVVHWGKKNVVFD